jgi:hypothetical protein
MQSGTLSKCVLRDLYGISYPTLRKRLRAAGLECFIARRKFDADEIYLIFKCLGLPTSSEGLAEEFCRAYEEAQAKRDNKIWVIKKKSGILKVNSSLIPLFNMLRAASIQLYALKGLLKLYLPLIVPEAKKRTQGSA